jgi:hypothetical protein
MPNQPVNPYAAPQGEIGSSGRGADMRGVARQQGDQLLIPVGSGLPDVCLFTGRRGTGRFYDKKLSWVPPLAFLTIFLGLLILIIVVLILQKHGRLRYYVDEEVVAKMTKATIVCWSLFGGCLLLVGIAIAAQSGLPALLALFLFIGMLVYTVVGIPRLSIAKIDKQYIYLKKVHPDAIDAIVGAA